MSVATLRGSLWNAKEIIGRKLGRKTKDQIKQERFARLGKAEETLRQMSTPYFAKHVKMLRARLDKHLLELDPSAPEVIGAIKEIRTLILMIENDETNARRTLNDE